ncbi:MAG: GNAT family N-acetyltransferase [Methanomassiliicoccus sp.]|nr:GNAT family N-acetyltransferase [Methanomassiliicoccus sp.]
MPQPGEGRTNMTDISFRTADRKDAPAIVDLMTGSMDWPGFRHEGTKMDFWNWRYSSNPHGFTNEVIAESDGRIDAHAASLPTGLVIRGRKRSGAQYSDLLTRESRRGQGIMERAVARLLERDREKGIELELAFPSISGEVVVRKAGFVELPVQMSHYELIADPDAFFADMKMGSFKKLAYGGLRMLKGNKAVEDPVVGVREVADIPGDIEDLIGRFQTAFDLVLSRDAGYLKWRYAEPRGGHFRIVIASKGGSTTGYMVLRPYVIDGRAYIDVADLVAEVGDGATITALVAMGARICKEEGASIMQIWLPADHPFLPDLGRSGFLLRHPGPGERKMKLMCRPLAKDLEEELSGELRCHLVLGDTDWI